MKIIYYAALALGFLISPVRAELKIDVNGAMREPMPIAFPQMSGSGEAASYGERIREVVIADLERSGLSALFRKTAISRLSPRLTNCRVSPTGKPLTPPHLSKAPFPKSMPPTCG